MTKSRTYSIYEIRNLYRFTGFAPDSTGFTKNYGDPGIRSRFSKRLRDSLKIQQETQGFARDSGIHSRFSKIFNKIHVIRNL